MARLFNASTEEVDFGDINAIDGATQVCMSWRMKKASSTNVLGFDKWSSTTSRIGMVAYSNGNFYGFIDDGAATNGAFTDAATTWGQFLMVFDGGGAANADRLKLYKDGVAKTLTYSGTTAAAAPTTAATVQAGFWREAGAAAADGEAAELAIWVGVVFSAQEALLLGNGLSPLALRPDKLVLYAPMFGTTSPEPDWSGNANHGTVTGATATDHPPKVTAVWLAPHPRLVQVAAAAAAGADGGGPRTFFAAPVGFP